MTLDGVIIYVSDVAATVRFYEQAFGMAVRTLNEDHQFAQMETVAMALSFAAESAAAASGRTVRPNRPADSAAPAIQITLVTEAIQEAFARVVAAGGTVVNPPTEKPWGQVLGVVRDNNGVLIEIGTPQSGSW